MQKPNSLRAVIEAGYPALANDPDRLNMWVEGGRIMSPMTPDRGFGWEYTLNITVTDMTQDPSIMALAINDWLRVNQPDLLAPVADAGYTFEADLIDRQTIDLHLKLKLTEQVAFVTNPDGTNALQYLPEPNLDWVNGTDFLTSPPVNLTGTTAAPGTTPVQFPNPAAGE